MIRACDQCAVTNGLNGRTVDMEGSSGCRYCGCRTNTLYTRDFVLNDVVVAVCVAVIVILVISVFVLWPGFSPRPR